MKLVPGGPDSGRIELHLRDLEQLFHTLDPSPFHDRSLDREAEDFVVTSARGFPEHAPLTLIIRLSQKTVLPDPGQSVADAVHTHFSRRAEQSHRELGDLFRRGRASLVIGVPILAVALFMGEMAPTMGLSPLSGILRESLIIGGWVAMWRPMEIFLYDWWPIREKRRMFERLARMEVRIVPAPPAV
jgi:hypothetical protein